jgi:hypothetical protein
MLSTWDSERDEVQNEIILETEPVWMTPKRRRVKFLDRRTANPSREQDHKPVSSCLKDSCAESILYFHREKREFRQQ